MAIWNQQEAPAVGKEYNFETGKFVYRGGDPQKNDSWAKAETWTATGAKIKGAITGQGRYEENIPEIGSSSALNEFSLPAFRTSVGLLNSSSADGAKNIVKNNIPNATFRDDAGGNTIAIIDGKEYYINRPGFSAQDAIKAAYEIVSFLGIGKIFGLGNKGNTLKSNIGRAVGTGTALSAGEDVVSQASGAERSGALSSLGITEKDLGIDLPKALLTGGLTGVFQGGTDIAFSAIPSLANALKNTQIRLGATDDSFFSATGELSAQGQQTLKQLGIEWNAMTREFKDRLRNQFVSGTAKPANPDEAIAYAEAQSLPVAVPQTKGALSADAEKQILEDLASKGVYGEEAKAIIKSAQAESQTALNSNISEIQKIIAGTSPIITKGEGGAIAQAELLATKDAAKKIANENFKKARELDSDSSTLIPSRELAGFTDTIKSVLRRDHAIDDLVPVQNMLKKITELETKDTTFKIRNLFELRAQINSKAKGLKGDESSVVLGKIKNQLDSKIDNMLETAILSGDDAVILAWKKAVKGWSGYKSKWDSGDLLTKITKLNNNGTRELAIAPESASNAIFGVSGLGFISKANLQRDLLKMKKELSPDAFNGLKQEIYLKLINQSKGNQLQNISGAKLQTNINKVLQENSSIMSALFSAEERALLEQFARVANRTLSTQKNFSNTGAAQMNAIKQMFTNVVAILGIKDQKKWFALFPFLKEAGNKYRTSQIIRATDNVVPSVAPAEAGSIASNVGYQTEELIEQQLRQN